MSLNHLRTAEKLGLFKNSNREVNGYTFLLGKIQRTQDKLRATTYKVTSSYSEDKSFNKVRPVSSNTERYAIQNIQNKDTLKELVEIRDTCIKSFYSAKLTTTERNLILAVYKQGGKTLSEFAKENGIYKSYVYKVRDRAVGKIRKEIKKRLIEL